MCRGDWSKRDEVLLTGDHGPLVPTFDAMRVSQLVLEFATPRAGELASPAGDVRIGRHAARSVRQGVIWS